MVSLGQILFWWNKQSTQFPFGAERKRWYLSCDCFSIHWTGLEALKYLQDLTGGWGPYHDFCVREIIAAISVDLKNSWQTVDHSFTAQDVRGVHLSIIHKQLHEENTGQVVCIVLFRLSCDQMQQNQYFMMGPFRLVGKCRAGTKTQASSLCNLRAEGLFLTDAAMPPRGNEWSSHPVQWQNKSTTNLKEVNK